MRLKRTFQLSFICKFGSSKVPKYMRHFLEMLTVEQILIKKISNLLKFNFLENKKFVIPKVKEILSTFKFDS